MKLRIIWLGGVFGLAALLGSFEAGAVSAQVTITVKEDSFTYGTCSTRYGENGNTSGDTQLHGCTVTVKNATPGAHCSAFVSDSSGSEGTTLNFTINSSGTGVGETPNTRDMSGCSWGTIQCEGVTVSCSNLN